jgi:hypothetical protein
MEKVFHFESPCGDYRSDAAVVWCFDFRFHLSFSKFLKRVGIERPDIIKVAGGAKSLASPDPPTNREFVLNQIRLSIRLHATPRVILMLHSDCGAYGGLTRGFGGDERLEAQRQEEELRRAAECVQQNFPGLEVRAYFANFEGVWEVAAVPAEAASPATQSTAARSSASAGIANMA